MESHYGGIGVCSRAECDVTLTITRAWYLRALSCDANEPRTSASNADADVHAMLTLLLMLKLC